MTKLSVGIPIHNEQEALPELLRRLQSVLDTIPGGPHEILFIDDGSTDGSRHLPRIPSPGGGAAASIPVR